MNLRKHIIKTLSLAAVSALALSACSGSSGGEEVYVPESVPSVKLIMPEGSTQTANSTAQRNRFFEQNPEAILMPNESAALQQTFIQVLEANGFKDKIVSIGLDEIAKEMTAGIEQEGIDGDNKDWKKSIEQTKAKMKSDVNVEVPEIKWTVRYQEKSTPPPIDPGVPPLPEGDPALATGSPEPTDHDHDGDGAQDHEPQAHQPEAPAAP